MTSEQTNVLIVKDQAGEYYLLLQEMLERGRVPEEHKAEVERLLAASDDVSGYATGDNVRFGIAGSYLGAYMVVVLGEYKAGFNYFIEGVAQAMNPYPPA